MKKSFVAVIPFVFSCVSIGHASPPTFEEIQGTWHLDLGATTSTCDLESAESMESQELIITDNPGYAFNAISSENNVDISWRGRIQKDGDIYFLNEDRVFDGVFCSDESTATGGDFLIIYPSRSAGVVRVFKCGDEVYCSSVSEGVAYRVKGP